MAQRDVYLLNKVTVKAAISVSAHESAKFPSFDVFSFLERNLRLIRAQRMSVISSRGEYWFCWSSVLGNLCVFILSRRTSSPCVLKLS